MEFLVGLVTGRGLDPGCGVFKPTKNQCNISYCILYIKMIKISSSNIV